MAQSLVCNDCGLQLKSVKEATDHNEATGHANFAESVEKVRYCCFKVSTEGIKCVTALMINTVRACNVLRAAQVLNMLCEDCGKPCRNKTQQDLHTKHTGHTRFVDKVSFIYKRISHSTSNQHVPWRTIADWLLALRCSSWL